MSTGKQPRGKMRQSIKSIIGKLLVRKVTTKTGCWVLPDKSLNSYGYVVADGKKSLIHRLIYQYYKGRLKSGLVINHLCSVKACFNPEHLEQVTMKENTHHAMKKGLLKRGDCRIYK